jgi:hypothetical protein
MPRRNPQRGSRISFAGTGRHIYARDLQPGHPSDKEQALRLRARASVHPDLKPRGTPS